MTSCLDHILIGDGPLQHVKVKTLVTFHYTAWLLGILKLTYEIIPLFTLNPDVIPISNPTVEPNFAPFSPRCLSQRPISPKACRQHGSRGQGRNASQHFRRSMTPQTGKNVGVPPFQRFSPWFLLCFFFRRKKRQVIELWCKSLVFS